MMHGSLTSKSNITIIIIIIIKNNNNSNNTNNNNNNIQAFQLIVLARYLLVSELCLCIM